jgi:hypothetical protein
MPSPDDNILIYFTAYFSNHPARASIVASWQPRPARRLGKSWLLPYLTWKGKRTEATGNMFLLQIAGKALNCCRSRK